MKRLTVQITDSTLIKIREQVDFIAEGSPSGISPIRGERGFMILSADTP